MKILYTILVFATLSALSYAMMPPQTDANDCMRGGCGPGGVCLDRGDGRSTCACKEGYRLGSSFMCEDINECLIPGLPLCVNGYCQNMIGSYYCECKEGFRRGPPDGKTCVRDRRPGPGGFLPAWNQILRCQMLNNAFEF